MWFIWFLMGAFVGFIASVFLWPKISVALNGIDKEIEDLRDRARQLESRLRAGLGPK